MRVACRYQLEALERAVRGNTLAFLETGSGKTLIAVMLLRAYAHRVRRPDSRRFAVFLVPTVVPMGQQARVVDSTSPAPLLLPPALDPLPPLLPAAELVPEKEGAKLASSRLREEGRSRRAHAGKGRGAAGEIAPERGGEKGRKRWRRGSRWRRNRREREGGIKKRGGWEEADSGSQVV